MTRKSRAVVLTLMGAGSIAFFMPGCDRNDNGTPTTQTSGGSGTHGFFGRSSSGTGSSHSSGVSRGGFGSTGIGHAGA